MGRWLTLLLAAALVAAGLQQFSGSLYYRVAKLSTWQSDVPRADAASGMATALGQSPAPAYRGRLAAVQSDADKLLLGYRQALRDAPADPYRWTELAQALARVGDFGPRFDFAVAQALRLGPRSPAVHLALADTRWRFRALISDAQRDALYPSFERTMYDRGQRQKLLDRIVRARRHPAFCAEYGAHFTGGRWCAAIDAELAACADPATLPKRQRRWCATVGALP